MGKRGSDVSREVADLVLLDDNFATIVAAIEEGRNIYENIKKFIRFLFSTNLAEVLIVVVGVVGASVLGLRDETGALLLPLTAVQLLWINIVTDGPPALALGLDRNSGVMRQGPRDASAPLLDPASLHFILVTGIAKALIGGALLALLPRYGHDVEETRTVVFLYAAIGQLVFAYPSRRTGTPPRFNTALHAAVFVSIAVQLLAVTQPALRLPLRLELPSMTSLIWVAISVMASWGIAEVYNRLAISWRRPVPRANVKPH
jgi:Ca2+-transporting ATPase